MRYRNVFAWIGVLGLGLQPARALINPNFTPVHLVREAETILEISFAGRETDGRLKAIVRAVLTGDARAPKEFYVDPSSAVAEGQRDAFVGAALREGQRALLFTGAFRPVGAEGDEMDLGAGGAGGPQAIGFLHMDSLEETQWAVLEKWKEDQWDFVKGENFLLATFNGATDMLRRFVEYLLADPEADVPVDAGARWQPPIAVGHAEGVVERAEAVYLTPPADPWTADLFLAGPGGDRLYRWRDGGLSDITGEVRLGSKSRRHAWGDFNGDGRLDLASYDGQALTIHEQREDGAFAPRAVEGAAFAADGGVRSLAVLSAGTPRAALLAGTSRGPVLAVFDENGKAACRPLAEAAGETSAEGGECLVADFDGDGWPDVLELGPRASRWYRGEALGRFASPQTVPVQTGPGRYGPVLGDFDHDGLPDLFVAAEERHLLWQNRGEGRFEEVMVLSGEVSYKLTHSGVLSLAEDFNNDGRTDLLIAYGIPQAPYILYNRGFRSFAHALDLDLQRDSVLSESGKGQQAIAFGDFDGDGFSDLVIVLHNGDIRLLRSTVGKRQKGLVVRACLPAGAGGPVRVVGTRFERPLGARLATPGRPAVFAARDPGPLDIVWRHPGGEERRREIVLEDGPVNARLER